MIPEKPRISICGDTLTEPAKEAQIRKSDELEGQPKEERKVTSLVEVQSSIYFSTLYVLYDF